MPHTEDTLGKGRSRQEECGGESILGPSEQAPPRGVDFLPQEGLEIAENKIGCTPDLGSLRRVGGAQVLGW